MNETEKRYNPLAIDTNIYGEFVPSQPIYLYETVRAMFPRSDVNRSVYIWIIQQCQLKTYLIKGNTQLVWVDVGSTNLSNELGYNPKSVRISLKFLEDNGFIECQRQKKGQANKYRYIEPKLLEALKTHREKAESKRLTNRKIEEAYTQQLNEWTDFMKKS